MSEHDVTIPGELASRIIENLELAARLHPGMLELAMELKTIVEVNDGIKFEINVVTTPPYYKPVAPFGRIVGEGVCVDASRPRKRVRIVRRCAPNGEVRYVIQQKHFLFRWAWVDASLNSWKGAHYNDTFYSLEEAKVSLGYFDGSRAVEIVVYE